MDVFSDIVLPLVAKKPPPPPAASISSTSMTQKASSPPEKKHHQQQQSPSLTPRSIKSSKSASPTSKTPMDKEKTTASTETTKTTTIPPAPARQLDVQHYVETFCDLACNCLDTAYSMERSMHLSPQRTGRLSTSLPEDVLSLLDLQYHSFLDFLLQNGFSSKASNASNDGSSNTKTTTTTTLTAEGQGLLTGILCFLLQQVKETQQRFRPLLLCKSSSCSSISNDASSGIQECCAAANDFWRMAEKLELFLERLHQEHKFLTPHPTTATPTTKSSTTNPFEDDYRDDTNETSPLTTTTTTTASTTTSSAVQQVGADLILQLSRDSVIAIERVQLVWMKFVHRQTCIASDLFSPSWEADWTHNDVVLDLLQSCQDIVLGPMEDYYYYDHDHDHLDYESGVDDDDNEESGASSSNQVLYNKAVIACCRALVCFYIQCLVQKADAIRRGRRRRSGPAAALRRTYHLSISSNDESSPYEQPFEYASRAVLRMTGDVQLIQEYFFEKTADNVTLSRIVSDEMRILELIQECLTTTILPHKLDLAGRTTTTTDSSSSSNSTCSGIYNGKNNNDCSSSSSAYNHHDSLEEFIVVIHKQIGADPLVTNMFMNDLWLLIAASSSNSSTPERHKSSKKIDQTIHVLQPDLHMVSRGMQELAMGKTAATAGANGTASPSSSVTPSALVSGGGDGGGGGVDVSFVRLDEMLKAIYEDRIVQGVVPLSMCWNCLPKSSTCATTNVDQVLVSQKIRTWSRHLTELRQWKFTSSPSTSSSSSPSKRRQHRSTETVTTTRTTSVASVKKKSTTTPTRRTSVEMTTTSKTTTTIPKTAVEI